MPKKELDSSSTNNLIFKLLEEAEEALLWSDMVQISKRRFGSDIRTLRRDLKELLKSQVACKSEDGYYSLVSLLDRVKGLVKKKEGRLYCDEYALSSNSKFRARVGDQIEGFLLEGEFVVRSITEHSRQPLLAIITTLGRELIAESLEPGFKGKIFVSSSSEIEIADISIGETVALKILGFTRGGYRGALLERVASSSVLEQAIVTSLKVHGVPCSWPRELQRSLESLPVEVTDAEVDDRIDLSSIPFVTIDGDSAKDFDDAVYAELLEDASWKLMVAIADVSHYVRVGGEIDKEAKLRGTSVYFPDTVIPMLPEELSNELCSLKAGNRRLVLVCEVLLNAEGDVVSYHFFEAAIRSHARLIYEDVQSYYSQQHFTEKLSGQVKASLDNLYTLYGLLQKRRVDRGALDFPENSASIELKNGSVTRINPDKRTEAHKLIEEMMILANVCAASFLNEQRQPGLYRNHEAPDILKLEQLRQSLTTIGVSFRKENIVPKDMQELLARLQENPKSGTYQQLVLRSMKQAIYSPERLGHFGLALDNYTHFTSPIRRYPDLLVHRSIKQTLVAKRKKRPVDADFDWQEAGVECSENERRAESAERAVDSWLKCDFLLSRIGETLEGYIAGVTDFGLFIELEGFFIQGLVHVTNLGQDYYKFYPNSSALVGEASGRSFRLGDPLRVKIVSVEPAQGKIDLHLTGNENQKRKKRPVRRKKLKRK